MKKHIHSYTLSPGDLVFSIGEKNIFFQLTKNIDIFVSTKDGDFSLYSAGDERDEIEKRQFRILFDSDK